MKTFLTYTTVMMLFLTSFLAVAGLDQAGRFDDVVAIYRFENANDSGPRDFDGSLRENATIVNDGKVNKGLRLRNDDWFAMVDDQHLGILGDFSILAWVKLRRQSEDFRITMAGTNDDGTIEGAISLYILSTGNIEGYAADFKDDESQGIETNDKNVSDNQWHHIAFTKFSGTAFLFLDGEVVKQSKERYLGFVGDGTFVSISSSDRENTNLTGSVFIDELGFFEIGFSVYEIKAIYDDGFTDFLEAMPVHPQQKMATTWGELKRRRF